MLANTLCHIPRVSLNKERLLWGQGVNTWAGYRTLAKNPDFLDSCERHLSQGNPDFFAENLKSDQHWRLFGDFKDSVAYVDIETTGLNQVDDQITTIALFDGFEVKTYVNGKNLAAFKNDIKQYKLLVTFNGKTFDAPFLRRFLGAELPKAHIDLRYVLKRLGFAGGLKEIERQIGIDRGDLKSVDGFFAVILWNEYKKRGNQAALETLLAYNCADVINLEQLMFMAYNLNVKNTPFCLEKQLKMPSPLKIPFKADPKLMNRYGR
jgi:uncharacterized protein